MNALVQRWMEGDGVKLASGQRVSHTHVIGQPGTGKSYAMESWAMQDILAGRGVCMIDVHGEMFKNMKFRIAQAGPSTWAKRPA